MARWYNLPPALYGKAAIYLTIHFLKIPDVAGHVTQPRLHRVEGTNMHALEVFQEHLAP